MIVILAGWLSKKINSPWLAAALGGLLIGLGAYGLANDDMPTIIAIMIIVIGVINVCHLLPQKKEQDSAVAAPGAQPVGQS
jgi:hypothetical protein